ncbi:nitroreductase [Lentisphaera marina]|uniref:nitroreductase family protein n=1 Tax=Lentisphaera marina TaxID=1111041 RepID=UPI0023669FD5|nr:nitroreductase [Lentisphaera marina]MDD7985631.1 nitroreductase [Lentisphaera marina]
MSSDVFKIISKRRTVKPSNFSEQAIPPSVLTEILESANWAPNHGRTEPWRLTVYCGEGKNRFHALLKEVFDLNPDVYPPEKLIKWQSNALAAQVIIAVGMKRTEGCKIPAIEELCAVASATQNMLITAEAHGICSYWGSSISHLSETPKALGLDGAEDKVIGFIHLGYPAEEVHDGLRKSSVEEKVTWIKE